MPKKALTSVFKYVGLRERDLFPVLLELSLQIGGLFLICSLKWEAPAWLWTMPLIHCRWNITMLRTMRLTVWMPPSSSTRYRKTKRQQLDLFCIWVLGVLCARQALILAPLLLSIHHYTYAICAIWKLKNREQPQFFSSIQLQINVRKERIRKGPENCMYCFFFWHLTFALFALDKAPKY